jgi:hypothetical protein
VTQQVAAAEVIAVLTMLSAVLGLWWRVETRISSGAIEAMKKAREVEVALHEYKVEVVENYAKNGFIRDVESRLGQRFDAIVDELHGLRQDFQAAMVDMAKKPDRRR